jgi:hypothetical protein
MLLRSNLDMATREKALFHHPMYCHSAPIGMRSLIQNGCEERRAIIMGRESHLLNGQQVTWQDECGFSFETISVRFAEVKHSPSEERKFGEYSQFWDVNNFWNGIGNLTLNYLKGTT